MDPTLPARRYTIWIHHTRMNCCISQDGERTAVVILSLVLTAGCQMGASRLSTEENENQQRQDCWCCWLQNDDREEVATPEK
mmetsp:Transcript_17052/g.39386  ORF Transcript_17052/g.39386 Transcript_17052/m.39386 type:complete len:82 (+) Transcript_17052:69-314(+)